MNKKCKIWTESISITPVGWTNLTKLNKVKSCSECKGLSKLSCNIVSGVLGIDNKSAEVGEVTTWRD